MNQAGSFLGQHARSYGIVVTISKTQGSEWSGIQEVSDI